MNLIWDAYSTLFLLVSLFYYWISKSPLHIEYLTLYVDDLWILITWYIFILKCENKFIILTFKRPNNLLKYILKFEIILREWQVM